MGQGHIQPPSVPMHSEGWNVGLCSRWAGGVGVGCVVEGYHSRRIRGSEPVLESRQVVLVCVPIPLHLVVSAPCESLGWEDEDAAHGGTCCRRPGLLRTPGLFQSRSHSGRCQAICAVSSPVRASRVWSGMGKRVSVWETELQQAAVGSREWKIGSGRDEEGASLRRSKAEE